MKERAHIICMKMRLKNVRSFCCSRIIAKWNIDDIKEMKRNRQKDSLKEGKGSTQKRSPYFISELIKYPA